MRVFVDADGVLADFDKRAIEILGVRPRDFEGTEGAAAMWEAIDAYPDFFFSLEPMPDAFELWNGIEEMGFEPIVLTGTPRWTGHGTGHGTDPSVQKKLWVNKWFSHDRVITCKSRNKCLHMEQPGDVLIDDWFRYQQRWIDHGGMFILHTDAKSSLETLKGYVEGLEADRYT